MTMKIYSCTFGNTTLRYAFHYERTPFFMRPYLKEEEGEEYDILSPLEYMESQRPYYPEDQEDAYVEYKSLIGLTSLALLKKKSVIFHAAAFRYQEKAILFTGRSGAGKTTQYKNWKKHFGNEIELISGDMPCLSVNEKEEILVSPTPWNGKERYKGRVSAPLGAVIFLEHAEQNTLSSLSAEEALIPLFRQFAVEPQDEEDIRDLSYIADIFLRKYPLYKFSNKADEEAVLLTAAALEEVL